MPFGKIQFSQKSKLGKQFQRSISCGKTYIRGALPQNTIQLLRREVRAMLLFAKNGKYYFALGGDSMRLLTQTIENRLRLSGAGGFFAAFVFAGQDSGILVLES